MIFEAHSESALVLFQKSFSTAKDGQLVSLHINFKVLSFRSRWKKGVKPYHRYALFEVKVTFGNVKNCLLL